MLYGYVLYGYLLYGYPVRGDILYICNSVVYQEDNTYFLFLTRTWYQSPSLYNLRRLHLQPAAVSPSLASQSPPGDRFPANTSLTSTIAPLSTPPATDQPSSPLLACLAPVPACPVPVPPTTGLRRPSLSFPAATGGPNSLAVGSQGMI